MDSSINTNFVQAIKKEQIDLGKSILAIQFGKSISRIESINGFNFEEKGLSVVCFDSELSDKRFD